MRAYNIFTNPLYAVAEMKCYSEPCQHGGACHEVFELGKFSCKCPAGYEGDTCEKGITLLTYFLIFATAILKTSVFGHCSK